MRQWEALAAIVLAAAIFGAGVFFGVKWGTAEHAEEAIKSANDRLEEVVAAQQAANKAAAELQRTLDRLPRAERKVNDAVRENPSPCERPAAVSGVLREAIRAANAAREVSADP